MHSHYARSESESLQCAHLHPQDFISTLRDLAMSGQPNKGQVHHGIQPVERLTRFRKILKALFPANRQNWDAADRIIFVPQV